MDQVKTAMAWVAKYHFWLLAVLIVLVSTLVWWMAAGDLDKRKSENLAKIDTAFSGQDNLERRPYHANPDFNAKQKSQIEALAGETKQIWQELYDRQRKEVLKWPAQLPASFRRQVEGKQFGDDINQLLREQYTDYIRGRFKDLPEIIDANEIEEEGSTGGFSGGGRGGFSGGFGGGGGSAGFRSLDMSAEPELDEDGNIIEVRYTVYWAPEDQERIRAELDSPNTISHWRLWATQENLWVYETLLRAIAATNEAAGADRYSNAAVSDIGAMQVGRDAAQEGLATGRIKRLQSGDSLSGDGGFDEMGPSSESDRSSFGDEEGFGEGEDFGNPDEGMSTAQEKAFWLSRRYIDGEGQPISVPPDEEPLAPGALGQELKRLPVRLVLRMDSRWLTTLMANLANADLQIKVTEVRVGVDPESSSGGYDGMTGSRGGGEGFGGGWGGGGSEEISIFDRKPYIKPVIVQGVVLIFNPPDDTILEGEGSDDSAEQFTSTF